MEHRQYTCLNDNCNHIARGTFSSLFHMAHGSHHLHHKNKHLAREGK